MSRIGKRPIQIPEKTNVTIDGNELVAKGEKGSLTCKINNSVKIDIEDNVILVKPKIDNRSGSAYQGMMRALIANMVKGVSSGFERSLEINGIGYRAEVKGKSIVFNIGYSNPVNFDLPEGVSAAIDKNIIKLSGIDKDLIGRTASSIRSLRPPEPYKGKGIKYAEERIIRKAGKTGTA